MDKITRIIYEQLQLTFLFREGHKEVSEILLNHNADVELPDNYGQSPLFMACWKGRFK